MKIIKVINNNTVCILDKKGREQIASGKGIGFGKKRGDEIDPAQVQKIYLITDSALRKRMVECLAEIPYEHIRLTSDLVDHIAAQLHQEVLKESLIISMSDHISFAIERQKQGMTFTNPLMDSIHDYFPEELALGRYCLEEIRQQLGVSLHEDEAGFLAMHIINARLHTNMGQVPDITKLVNGCAEIADTFYRGKLDKTTVSYERFLVHLKYLAKRLFQSQEFVLSRDEEILDFIRAKFQKHYRCAKCIQDYILKNFARTISEDEMMTLTIHLKKISESR